MLFADCHELKTHHRKIVIGRQSADAAASHEPMQKNKNRCGNSAPERRIFGRFGPPQRNRLGPPEKRSHPNHLKKNWKKNKNPNENENTNRTERPADKTAVTVPPVPIRWLTMHQTESDWVVTKEVGSLLNQRLEKLDAGSFGGNPRL